MRGLRKSFMSAACAAALLLGSPFTAEACTSFLLTSTDGSPVYGRTMEFGQAMDSSVVLVPQGYEFTSTSGAEKPAKWTALHNVIGMNALGGETMLVDGINDKGLAGGLLYFPGYAEYPKPEGKDPAKVIGPGDMLAWILSSFATVEEVRKAVSSEEMIIAGFYLPALKQIPPGHLTLHDATGASIVIEPIGGKMVIRDNPLGVMTNAPTFDWHITNLRNYVNLSSVNRDDATLDKKAIAGFGQGTGLLGLPGDPTPPSRFIRAASYAAEVEPGADASEMLRVAEHVLNNFDIPVGWIKPGAAEIDAGSGQPDYTQWSVMADIKNGTYFVRQHNMTSFLSVGFDDFASDAKDLKVLPLPQGQEPYAKLSDASGSK